METKVFFSYGNVHVFHFFLYCFLYCSSKNSQWWFRLRCQRYQHWTLINQWNKFETLKKPVFGLFFLGLVFWFNGPGIMKQIFRAQPPVRNIWNNCLPSKNCPRLLFEDIRYFRHSKSSGSLYFWTCFLSVKLKLSKNFLQVMSKNNRIWKSECSYTYSNTNITWKVVIMQVNHKK